MAEWSWANVQGANEKKWLSKKVKHQKIKDGFLGEKNYNIAMLSFKWKYNKWFFFNIVFSAIICIKWNHFFTKQKKPTLIYIISLFYDLL